MLMRPPVAAVYDTSPHRRKSYTISVDTAQKNFGKRVTSRVVLDNNFTSDAKWNTRHHFTPSQFNKQNKIYHRVFFDKEIKNNENRKIKELTQKKVRDPYNENEK